MNVWGKWGRGLKAREGMKVSKKSAHMGRGKEAGGHSSPAPINLEKYFLEERCFYNETLWPNVAFVEFVLLFKNSYRTSTSKGPTITKTSLEKKYKGIRKA